MYFSSGPDAARVSGPNCLTAEAVVTSFLRSMGQIPDIVKLFAGRQIAVFGDVVADQFLNGTISRVSREAPVFILRHDATETRPGAAANAAANIASLGGVPRLIGLVGEDRESDLLRSALRSAKVASDGLISDPALRTTTKVRVLAGQHYAPRQQVIRIDYENDAAIPAETRAGLVRAITEVANVSDGVVISDYGYGVVESSSYEAIREVCLGRGIPLIVDSRMSLAAYQGATSATPNQEEAESMIGRGFSADDCEAMRKDLGHEAVLVTRGNKGMILAEKGRAPFLIEAVGSTVPVDVTGAGDTVIAAYALGLAAGLTFAEAARVANHAGGLVVMKRGTATATSEEVAASLADERPSDASDAAGQ